MQVVKLKQFKNSSRFQSVMARGGKNDNSVLKVAEDIVVDVKNMGDVAVKKYMKSLNGVCLRNLRVSKEEINKAQSVVSDDFVIALKQAVNNIRLVHNKQISLEAQSVVSPLRGIKVWKKWQPIEIVGVYVPGGLASYPSSVLMSVIPAQIAGCKKIIITTPPRPDGLVAPEVLVAANYLGVKDIFKISGAQAIAALAYGTETIPKVYKIVGPGNAYVATAKMIVSRQGEVAIDSPAGPSEVLIIADKTANPEFVAADLMCDSEHAEDSAAVLLSTSLQLARRVIKIIKNTVDNFSTGNRVKKSLKSYGLFATVKTLGEAVDFANDYAPEHIQIMTKRARAIAKKITNAGSVFIGPYTCKSAGDYATGANHVLPTGGSAKMFSGLSVFDFVRLVEYQQVSKGGLKKIRRTIQVFARVEKLPVHEFSGAVRFKEK